MQTKITQNYPYRLFKKYQFETTDDEFTKVLSKQQIKQQKKQQKNKTVNLTLGSIQKSRLKIIGQSIDTKC